MRLKRRRELRRTRINFEKHAIPYNKNALEDHSGNRKMTTKRPAIYILASNHNGTLYIGVTSDLGGRISVHKQNLLDGFTKRYGIHMLVHYEFFHTMEEAISREKKLKKFSRAKKIALIEEANPSWNDLYDSIQN